MHTDSKSMELVFKESCCCRGAAEGRDGSDPGIFDRPITHKSCPFLFLLFGRHGEAKGEAKSSLYVARPGSLVACMISGREEIVSCALTLKRLYSKSAFQQPFFCVRCVTLCDYCRSTDGGRATLLLLDRADDLLSPLMHEFTYQCLVEDLLGITVRRCVFMAFHCIAT